MEQEPPACTHSPIGAPQGAAGSCRSPRLLLSMPQSCHDVLEGPWPPSSTLYTNTKFLQGAKCPKQCLHPRASSHRIPRPGAPSAVRRHRAEPGHLLRQGAVTGRCATRSIATPGPRCQGGGIPCRTPVLCGQVPWLWGWGAVEMGGSGDDPTSAAEVLGWHTATEGSEKGRTEGRRKAERAG